MSAPHTSALTRARAAWGDDLPEWVAMLATACDQQSQSAIAWRLSCSGAAVSQVLNRKYRASLAGMEARVRGVLLAETVDCPVVGSLRTDACMEHQRAPWAPHNPQRIEFYRACRACPHFMEGKANAE